MSETEEAGPRSAVEGVRRAIEPGAILFAGDVRVAGFDRKAIYNALTYLTRTGELKRIGYGKYISPAAAPSHLAEERECGGPWRCSTETLKEVGKQCYLALDGSRTPTAGLKIARAALTELLRDVPAEIRHINGSANWRLMIEAILEEPRNPHNHPIGEQA